MLAVEESLGMSTQPSLLTIAIWTGGLLPVLSIDRPGLVGRAVGLIRPTRPGFSLV
jgi:hypothetical protein